MPTDPSAAPPDSGTEEPVPGSQAPTEPPVEDSAESGPTTLVIEAEAEPSGERPAGSEGAYKVALDVFEGPMDLLLYLIKKDEIDIYDIPIESVTKQYMEYLETFKMLNIGLAGEFLVMAANLCYIKSRMMLPKHVQPPEEDADEEDPRWDLIRQLIEYKKFKEAAHFLGRKESEQQDHFAHKPEKIESDEGDERPLSDEIGIFDLIRAFQSILDRFQDEGLGEIVDDHHTVSDKIDHLLTSVPPGESIRFSSLFAGATSKNEMIVTFLAVLELMKLNYFRVQQEVMLGEIELLRNEATQ
ncbi:MAG: segregation/condensation protein A [Verrucomicrobiota bacterium]